MTTFSRHFAHWPPGVPQTLEVPRTSVYSNLTARAAQQRHLLESDSMKDWFQEMLFALCDEFGWRLEAWAVL